MSAPTREELVELCTRGVVPHEHWYNRDTYAAQTQLGKCRALLAAGCEFVVHHDARFDHWDVSTWARGFNSVEFGDRDEDNREYDTFYVPTAERLERAAGGDWY